MGPVVFYHDGSSDDYIALSFLEQKLKETGGELLGVINAGTGEVNGLQGATNTARVCDFLGLKNIPIGYGVSESFDKTKGEAFPDYIRSFADTLIDKAGLPPTKRIDFKPAVELFEELLSKSTSPVTIIATGPLTDLALLLKSKPSLRHKIGRIVMMGGAIVVPGNIKDLDPTSTNTVAEWNIWADPAAAHAVFSNKDIPVTLVPLDITNQIPVTREFYNILKEIAENNHNTPVALAYELITVLKDAFEKANPNIDFFSVYYLWDPLAAMLACEPKLAVYMPTSGIQVDVDTGKTSNGPVAKESNNNMNGSFIALKPQAESDILKVLLQVLQPSKKKDVKLLALSMFPSYPESDLGKKPDVSSKFCTIL